MRPVTESRASFGGPRVTVIIPTWNWSAVLPYAIASVRAQTLTDFELLVIGDGCTDDSAAVVARAAGDDPRVQWINLAENYGQQAWPNNEGLRRARGPFIAYLGHDDLWLPDHLARLVAALEAGADIAYCPVAYIETKGTVRRAAPPYTAPPCWLPPTGVMHRKTLTDRVGPWADWRTLTVDPETDLWARCYAAGARFVDTGHVSAIKLPAAARQGVYKTKPCHEQATWAARIAAEPTLADTLTAQLTAQPNIGRLPKPTTLRGRLWILLPWRLRRWIRQNVFRQRDHLVQEPGESYTAFFTARKRFKGIKK
jgi:hypothetical protein